MEFLMSLTFWIVGLGIVSVVMVKVFGDFE